MRHKTRAIATRSLSMEDCSGRTSISRFSVAPKLGIPMQLVSVAARTDGI